MKPFSRKYVYKDELNTIKELAQDAVMHGDIDLADAIQLIAANDYQKAWDLLKAAKMRRKLRQL